MSENLREVSRDAVVLAVGVVLVVSTIWLPVEGDAGVSGAILVLGMVSAGTALWAMSSASRSSHWAHLALGAMLALSPVVLTFPSGLMVTDMFAVVGGLLIAAMGVLGVLDNARGTSVSRIPSTVVASSGTARARVRVSR
ncbi:hypothetical protein HQ346_18145 [Rhodococcus sp. BP-252]|uniref:SPW repeat-containing integral membrane domain-containing protein n=1 Tax=Rhodococcoides kyotonense TaxID=398843 RepID=A0A177Y990_9NOCA|nr:MULTISPECIES: hypothetical protein [Rhodococcus]MBY6413701.1 hypothetical protein [Rhodococcus sp. BP-320]MBY6418312.1 hypothetical protein [Rhodococcus sp. BP-321]MBY6422437.1 hypothetical protein [Rhodococcus sp. BP-324]MBY6428257.1 hypothetical protein [Rhodococcus sp. BP-323]MBY6433434.1 hypothetical protein [Rhodococcus sp. BP-322]